MFQAQMLTANGTAGGSDVYGPWFPRGGDNMIATVEIISMSGASPTGLLVEVYTKAKSDASEGAQVTTGDDNIGSTSTAGRYTGTFYPLNELVRYKFRPGTTDGKWVLFRMLPPSFFDTVK